MAGGGRLAQGRGGTEVEAGAQPENSPSLSAPPLLHHRLPASICLPSSSSIHKIRAALPPTVACGGRPAGSPRPLALSLQPPAPAPGTSPQPSAPGPQSPGPTASPRPKAQTRLPTGQNGSPVLALKTQSGSLRPAPHASLRCVPAGFGVVSSPPSGSAPPPPNLLRKQRQQSPTYALCFPTLRETPSSCFQAPP